MHLDDSRVRSAHHLGDGEKGRHSGKATEIIRRMSTLQQVRPYECGDVGCKSGDSVVGDAERCMKDLSVDEGLCCDGR